MESNKFTKFYGYFVKLKKIQPEHVHVEGGVCMLCETHGNVMDPGLPYCGFEGCDVVTQDMGIKE